MDDSLGVGGVKRIRQLNTPVEQPIEWHRARTQAVVEGLALEQLHGNERLRLILQLDFFDRKNGADVGMIQRRGSARLQQKTVQSILIAGKLRRQKLQRNLAPQIEILRFVDYAHPTAAQLAGDAVMRDGLADHGRIKTGKFILGGMRKAVKPA